MNQLQTTSSSLKIVSENQPNKIVQVSNFQKFKKQIFDALSKAECLQNKQAKFVCSSSNCRYSKKKHCCYDLACLCFQAHQQCPMMQSNYINKFILSNLIDTEKLVKQVDSIFDKMIDFISEERQKVIKKIKFNFGHTSNEINYLNKFRQNLKYCLNKDIIQRIIKDEQTSKLQRVKSSANRLTSDILKLQTSINPFFKQINMRIQTFCETVCPQYFNSKIIQTQDEKDFIFKQLKEVVNLQSLSLLYRATDNDFNTLKFEQKCNQKSNLLILIKNQNGKKYGAYTPCTYKSNQKSVFQQDHSMKSFLFTLSDRLKFKLLKKQFAMCNSNRYDYMLSFGQNQPCSMLISRNANTSKSNWFNPSSTYQENPKFNSSGYSENGEDSLRLLQYEVYQIVEQKSKQSKV